MEPRLPGPMALVFHRTDSVLILCLPRYWRQNEQLNKRYRSPNKLAPLWYVLFAFWRATNMQTDRTIFNAIPMPAFVVNDDVQILDLNDAAVRFCGQDRKAVIRVRGGEVLGCLHSMDVTEGCGRGKDCQSCIIRTTVVSCLKGKTVHRQMVNFQIAHGLVVKELQVLVTVSPLPDEGDKRALLMIEDITEFSTLKSPLHICMKCKRIWDEQHYWTEIETYFCEHAAVEFSHGMCPKCVKNSEFR